MTQLKEMNPREPKTVTLIAFVMIAIACVILNLLTSPLLWAMAVIGFERLVWKLIFSKRLFENSLPNKIQAFVRSVSVMLIGLMVLLYQYPAVIISLLVISSAMQLTAAILYLLQYRKNAELSPVYLVDRLLVGLLCFILGLIVNSYAVMMISVAAIMFIAPALILIQDTLLFESKKKLHVY